MGEDRDARLASIRDGQKAISLLKGVHLNTDVEWLLAEVDRLSTVAEQLASLNDSLREEAGGLGSENDRLRADLCALAEVARPFTMVWYRHASGSGDSEQQSRALADVLARVEGGG